MTKAELRNSARNLKKSVNFKNVSEGICKNILAMPEFVSARCVMLYNALADEPSLSDIAAKSEKEFCFPAVIGDNIVARMQSSIVRTGRFGITEPMGGIVRKSAIDLIFVPGVMFDRHFNRLGRGKGFYDRFLRDFCGVKVGVCPDALFKDIIRNDEFDVKMDAIVTETLIYKG